MEYSDEEWTNVKETKDDFKMEVNEMLQQWRKVMEGYLRVKCKSVKVETKDESQKRKRQDHKIYWREKPLKVS